MVAAIPGSSAEGRSTTMRPSTWAPRSANHSAARRTTRSGCWYAAAVGRTKTSRPPEAANKVASKVQPSVHSSPPTRASVPVVSMRHSCTPARRPPLRRPWLPSGKLPGHVDEAGGNRRFGDHGRGHRRGGGGGGARGGPAQQEQGRRGGYGGRPRQVARQA